MLPSCAQCQSLPFLSGAHSLPAVVPVPSATLCPLPPLFLASLCSSFTPMPSATYTQEPLDLCQLLSLLGPGTGHEDGTGVAVAVSYASLCLGLPPAVWHSVPKALGTSQCHLSSHFPAGTALPTYKYPWGQCQGWCQVPE